jgi:hypothetical protein
MKAVNCYGESNFQYRDRQGPPPWDSLDFRIGGSVKRHAIFEIARKWNARHKNDPPFKVSVVDAWQLTDNRLETTAEGRHWIAEDGGEFATMRKGIGESEGISLLQPCLTYSASVLDRIWDDFITERMTI